MRQHDAILHAARIRHCDGARSVGRHGRQVDDRRGAVGAPGAEIPVDGRPRGGRSHLADDHDGGEVGTEHAGVVGAYRRGGESPHRLGRGHAQTRIIRWKQRRAQRALCQEAGAGVARSDTQGQLAADDLHGRIGQRRVQFIVGQQFQRALEMLTQHLHREIRTRMLAGTDRIQRLLERDPIEPFTAVGQQPIEHLRDSFLALGLFGLGAIADVAVHAHRVADILALHDQGEAVRQRADDRVQGRGRHLQTLQSLLCPGGQGGRVRLAQGNRLLPAEPAVRRHRLTRAARQHDAGDGVIEVEILARHPVDVRDRDPLDARQILIRRIEPVLRQRLRPHCGEFGDVVALELRRAALLQLGRLDELRRDACARDARQYRAHLVLERLGVISGGKGEHRVGKCRLRQRVKRELRGHRLALGHEAVQIEAPAAEHVREHLERGEVGSAGTCGTQRNHERTAGPVGVEREGCGLHGAQAHPRLGRQLLRRDVPEQ